MTPNELAFLAMLAHAEGTDRADNPYRVCYTFRHTILDLSDHPTSTREWMGEKITEGIYAGELSTAAGRYQINHPTWVGLKLKLRLGDFTAPSQDTAALDLIDGHGAIALINAGELGQAIALCSGRWASLPGNTSGQPQRSLELLTDVYQGAGGSLA